MQAGGAEGVTLTAVSQCPSACPVQNLAPSPSWPMKELSVAVGRQIPLNPQGHRAHL